MAFWKKKPDEEKPAAPEKTGPVPDWYRKEEPPEPVDCPWCGNSMVYGTLCGTGRGSMQWREGPYQGGLDFLRFTGRKLDLEEGEPAWYCESCGSILLQTGRPLEKAGPNYVWENGKPVIKTEE